MKSPFSSLAAVALIGCLLPQSALAQQDEQLDALLRTGRQLLEENQDEIRDAIGQLEGRAQELREKMIDDAVPTAVYDRLEMKPISESQLKNIQDLAGRALQNGDNWAKVPVLAAMRYQSRLRGGDEVGYGSIHLRCQLDSPQSPSQAVVTIIEDQVTTDDLRGQRWDIALMKDPQSGVWIPETATTATLKR